MTEELTSPHHNPVPHGLDASCVVSSRANDGAAFFMTKPKMKVLERLFSHEFTGEFPLQNFRPSKHWKALEEEGMLHAVQYRIGPVTCQGWELTPLGHMTYCQSCTEEPK